MSALFIIQCRLGSTRLPGKALYPIAGIPLLAFLLRRVLSANLPGQVVLATTMNPEDNIIEAWGLAEGVSVVRGKTDDVLARYLQCLDQFPASCAVRITADNPFIDTVALRQVAKAVTGGYDYAVAYEGFPHGTGADAFTRETLERIAKASQHKAHREHLNAYILDHPQEFSCCTIEPRPTIAYPTASFTVDTYPQYAMLAALLASNEALSWDTPLEDFITQNDTMAGDSL